MFTVHLGLWFTLRNRLNLLLFKLKETTMHIGSRVLKRITMDDAVAADATFELLMGTTTK